jgi:hypothetical protein
MNGRLTRAQNGQRITVFEPKTPPTQFQRKKNGLKFRIYKKQSFKIKKLTLVHAGKYFKL